MILNSSKVSMSGEDKQREWIWEHFLKHCKDPQMINELINAYPIPNESLRLKKMMLLRFLSIQRSTGDINDLTLDFLRGLAELSKIAGGASPVRDPEPNCSHLKKTKVPDDKQNENEVGLSIGPCTPFSPRTARVLPWISHASAESEMKEWKNDATKDTGVDDLGKNPVMTIANLREEGSGQSVDITNERDDKFASMKVLERTEDMMDERGEVDASKEVLEQAQDVMDDRDEGTASKNVLEHAQDMMNERGKVNASKNVLEQAQNMMDERYEGNASMAGTLSGVRDLVNELTIIWSGYTFGPGQSPREWELLMLVRVELAVKHLRGDSPNMKLFENAVAKYWGDTMESSEHPLVDMSRIREQIESELWMVRRNPELLNEVLKKYTLERLEFMLKTYVAQSWEDNGQSFLERVSADVSRGKYKPVNSSGKMTQKTSVPSADGEAAEEQARQTPRIRASRGRFSRSREKLQKRFAILDLEQDDEEDARIKIGCTTIPGGFVGGKSDKLNQGGDEVRASVIKDGLMGKDGSEARISHSTGCELGIDAVQRSQGRVELSDFETPVAGAVEFEVPTAPKLCDQQEPGEKVQEFDINDKDRSEAAGVRDIVGQTEGSLPATSLDTRRASGACDLDSLFSDRQTPTGDGKGTEDVNGRHSQRAEPLLSHEEAAGKENASPPMSPNPSDLNQNAVFFSTPPWVAKSSVANGAEREAPGLTRKRKSGVTLEDAGEATTGELPTGVETTSADNRISQSPETTAAQTNLKRKQTALDAVVQDPLPNILLTSRVRRSVMERNATASTSEWGEDDIEQSPPSSPSASRRVRLPQTVTGHKISPLAGAKPPAVNRTRNRTGNQQGGRRKVRRWSTNEVEALKSAVRKYGKGRWKLILESNLNNFQGRTEVDLKDKWRNLERFEGLSE